MEQKMNGLSRDFIIHPGETLNEILEDREMSQKELAIRSGVTEKHVSTIINGTKPISVAYAKKLEYAIGIDASFWINLQSNYDKELLEFEEFNNISKEEIAILKPLKIIIEYLNKINKINSEDNEAAKVLDLRKILGVSNLTSIPDITYNAAYRAQVATKADVYVLFAWQKICEILTEDIEVAEALDTDKLREKLLEIKRLMFAKANTIQKELKKIFAECGIAFEIVRHFQGAPVQGFIKRNEQGRTILCMTIRGGFADRFWFTLFHEIAHILNGDAKLKFIDFDSIESEIEERANKFARNTLLSPIDYKRFLQKNDFSLRAISDFSEKQEVCTFIVIARLQKNNNLERGRYSSEIVTYKWASE